ncbi:MAG: pyridoxal phosphate-dependent decarboxylase family protein [Gemmatimonadales bacterium]
MSDRTGATGFFAAGRSADEIRAELVAATSSDAVWKDRRNLRASYFAGDDVVAIATEAFTSCLGKNALYGALAYPSVRRFEAEVVEILLRLMRAPAAASGSITTGGTESIFMAVKTARDWARAERPAATRPTVVVARTAHAAFDKAAQLLGLTVRRMTASPDYRADIDGMANAIDANTIMIVGSAPPYAYGVVDPLPVIAELADRHGLWMHVDGCVGGMVLPFIRDLGHPLPTFDFSLPSVTSISIDLHKYGYAFHGCSALLLRTEAMTAYQRYEFDAWPVGLYSTTNFVGSRGAGPVASAWAVMSYLGHAGYQALVARMVDARVRLVAGIGRVDGLAVCGKPDATLLSFGSDSVDMTAVGQEMNRRGWSFARQTDPPSVLLLLNGFHGEIVDEFLGDLEETVRECRAGRVRAGPASAVYTV